MKLKKQKRILFNAFVEAADDAHISWLLYSSEVWHNKPSLKRLGTVEHAPKWENCQVDMCKMRYELASFIANVKSK